MSRKSDRRTTRSMSVTAKNHSDVEHLAHEFPLSSPNHKQSSDRGQSPHHPFTSFEHCKLSRGHAADDVSCDGFEGDVGLRVPPKIGLALDPTSLACKEDKLHSNQFDCNVPSDAHYKTERELMEEELSLAEQELQVRRRRLEFEKRFLIATCESDQDIQLNSVHPRSSQLRSSGCTQGRDVDVTDNLSPQETKSVIYDLQSNLKWLSLGVGLPKIEVEHFDGSPRRYWSFVRGFEAAVADKLSDEGQKLSYLLHYCRGRAKQAIEHCVFYPKDQGYAQARQILATQFGRSHTIVQAVTKELFEGPKLLLNDVEGLRQLAFRMKGCQITLSQMQRTAELNCSANLTRLVDRFPRTLQERWVDVATGIIEKESEPTFDDLLAFVERQISRASNTYGQLLSSTTRSFESASNSLRVPRFQNNSIEAVRTDRLRCPLCSANHQLDYCQKFLNATTEARRQIALANKRCFVCLKPNHVARLCRSNVMCAEPGCGARHNRLLHVAQVPPRITDSLDCGSTYSSNKHVRLGYVPVCLEGPVGTVQTYAFLDNGSDTSLISKEIAERLGLVGAPCDILVRTLNGTKKTNCKAVSFRIRSISNDSVIDVAKAYTTEKLPVTHIRAPGHNELQQWSHLSDLKFEVIDCDKVGLLIGCDVPEVHWVLEQRIGTKIQPFAVRSPLGWILRGPVSQDSGRGVSYVNCTECEDLSKEIRKLYELEFSEDQAVDKRANSIEDQEALDLVLQSVRLHEGHYEIGLPWRNKGIELCDNRKLAESRLAFLKRRLICNPVIKSKYDDVLRDHERKGYIRQVNLEPSIFKKRWFLPHHYVLNSNKPGKVRVVFDCAAVYQGRSLNKALLQGPDFTNNLIGVLIRFRKYAVAVSADIKEMFLQVRVPERDRWALSFLYWCDGNLEGQPVIYEMNSHPFGATSSPFCANFALQRTAEDNSTEFSAPAIAAIRNNFYVDDCLLSLETEDEAIKIADELRRMANKGGFHLTKWMSNKPVVIASLVKGEEPENAVSIDMKTIEHQRALGLRWNISDDCFLFDLKLPDVPLTKRGILKCVASFYDPLGFVAPMLLPARKILQDLSQQGSGWDSEIMDSYKKGWLKWLDDMRSVASLRIERCLIPNGPSKGTCELHMFSDASEIGYGAVGYLRFTSDCGVRCRFLMGKSRVTPKKCTTIPRLELVAAVLSCKLMRHIVTELQLQIDRIVLWTDSTIVLQYLRNTSARFATFVANRVRMILDRSDVSQWRHVPTNHNPADVASRGTLSASSREMSLWLDGPAFLLESEDHWPTDPPTIKSVSSDDLEVRRVCTLTVKQSETSVIEKLSGHYSNWWKLVKAVAWLKRFMDLCRAMRVSSNPTTVRVGSLCTDEILHSVKTIVRLTQAIHFESEFKSLESSRSGILPLNNNLRKLKPVCNQGVLYLGGRVAAREGSLSNRLMILPAHGRVTDLLVHHYHEVEGHAGASHVLASIRKRFWVIRGMATVRRVLAKCSRCKLLFPRPLNQVMAPLPSCRITGGGYPFEQCGVDYFGPFLVKIGRSECKRYGCIFTCLETRAIHLEVAHNMTADSFLMAMIRFMGRRGRPKAMWSDNGSNFIAAESSIRALLNSIDQEKLKDGLLQYEVDWHFQPPSASHRGGVWERMIRSVRRILTAVSAQQSLSDETLLTYIVEVERVVNDRPLIPVYDDPSSPHVLSPNDLLLLRSNPTYLGAEVTLAERYTKGWRQASHLASVFWKRWRREYLPTLQASHKWFKVEPNLKVGDLVLLIEGNAPRGVWPKGVVVEVLRGIDDNVRQVLVRTNSGVLRRDIRSLSLLEGASDPK